MKQLTKFVRCAALAPSLKNAVVFMLLLLLCGIPATLKAQLPTVTSVSPLVGYPASSVIITGTNFNATPADNIVYFGATRATVTVASATSLTVTIPSGATVGPVTVQNIASGLVAYSQKPFIPSYDNAAYAPGIINFKPQNDVVATTGSPAGIILADIDGDGRPDMLMTDFNTNKLIVYKNISTGGTITSSSFEAGRSFSVFGIQSFATGDIDGDGKPDVVTSGTWGFSVLLNTSTGGAINFASAQWINSDTRSFGVAICDVDGDGKADITTTNVTDSTVSVVRNRSTVNNLSFAPEVIFSTGTYPMNVIYTDIDGDTKPDMCVSSANGNGLSVLINNSISGAVDFAAKTAIVTGRPTLRIAAGDLDGDGKTDLAVVGQYSVYIFHNTSSVGAVSFDVSEMYSVSTPGHIAIADMDGNGKPDVVSANSSSPGYITVFLNKSLPGTISFDNYKYFRTAGQPSGFVVGDMDGDSKPDVITCSWVSSAITILQNDPFTPISGTKTICAGTTTALSESVGGGTWSTYYGYIATVDASGLVTGMSGGSAEISYTSPGGGLITTTVTVVTKPNIYLTSNSGPVCRGAAVALNGAATGGSTFSYAWSGPGAYTSTEQNPSVPAASAGTYTLTVSNENNCTSSATTMVTLNPVPEIGSVGSNSPVCLGDLLSLSSTATGGTGTPGYAWAGPNTFAAAGDAPVVSPTATLAAEGTYTLIVTDDNGCADTAATSVTVHDRPVITDISSNTPVCAYQSLSLSSSIAGGAPSYTYSWTGPNGFISAEEDPLVSASATTLEEGTYLLTVTDANNCAATGTNATTVTIDQIQPITGTMSLAANNMAALSNATPGGVWNSASPGIATVDAATGIVTGLEAGTAIISYTAGCTATATLTVTATATNIVCVGQAITLDNGGMPGGTWSSSNGSIANVVAATGRVAGVHPGTVLMYYFMPSGGFTTTTVTVKALSPTGVSTSSVCQGQTLTATNITAGGGVWGISDPGIASIGATGVVTGTGGGAAVVSFTATNGCVSTRSITVKPSAAITGDLTVCAGQTTTLSASIAGGNWLSSSAALATVTTAGVVKGVGAGSPRITYIPANGCWSATTITVNALSSTTGVTSLCQGQSAAFTNTTAGGGTWSSDNTLVATVSAAGIVTGTGSGTANIIFTSNAGCSYAKSITINPAATITGSTLVCVGQLTNLSNSIGGGTWSSSSNLYATVSSSGMVTGVNSGTVRISYAIAGGCASVATVTVNALNATTGAGSVCLGQTTSLVNTTAGGGIWSSDNTSVATVSNSGVVSGTGSGSAVILFTTTAGCTSLKTITVAPGATISGGAIACTGQATALSADVSGGAWSSSSNSYATVSSAGVVTGVNAGTVRITYALSGCQSVATMTVNQVLATTGVAAACQNQPITLANATPGGGVWSSGNTAIANVSSTGVVTAVASGSVPIFFTAGNGCIAVKTVTLNATGTITGNATVCVGQLTQLSNSIAGGIWASSAGSLATVSAAGVVGGVSAGTPGITYVAPGGCWAAVPLTVKALSPITGGTPGICASSSMTLANATPFGGVWSSSNTSAATVSATGFVKGTGAGVSIISFTTNMDGCVATRTVTVNACREADTSNTTSVSMQELAQDVRLFPNPNKGIFILKGDLNAAVDEEIYIEVVNMLGQVIYQGGLRAQDGGINKQIELQGNLAHGMYLLHIRGSEWHKVIHFVVSQ